MLNDTCRKILSKWEIKKLIKSLNYDDTFGEHESPNKLGPFDSSLKETGEKSLLMVIQMNILITVFVKASYYYWHGMKDPLSILIKHTKIVFLQLIYELN